ncbi:MAG: DUF4127 family protein [Firmicutes bacterium]|nr:DUF4127 family protein [Bacillota bacterium]
MRFIDDWLYQSKIRQEIAFEVKSRGGEPSNLKEYLSMAESVLSKKILPVADKFFKKHFSGRKKIINNGKENLEVTIGKELHLTVCLPWRRLFEIELEIDFALE